MQLENNFNLLSNPVIDTNESLSLNNDDNLSRYEDLREISNDKKEENKNDVVDKTIDGITKTLQDNISKEIENLKLDETAWKKIGKGKVAEIAKVAVEAVLKGILKKKFNINYSTFNDVKNTINMAMNGDLKNALKVSSDAAIDNIKVLNATTKTTIKTVKNAIIDKTIDSEKYEILNKQTKVLNRISKNCEKFDKALEANDAKTIKSKANAIKKDMKEIIPIRETISRAQKALDKYSLWQNKGNISLTGEEIELIDKLNNCA